MAWEKLPVQAWYRSLGEMQHMEKGESEDGAGDLTVIKQRS